MTSRGTVVAAGQEIPGYARSPLPSEYLVRLRREEVDKQSLDKAALGLAAPLMAIGAFFTGYQALRIGPINLTLSDIAFASAFAICAWRGRLTSRPFGGFTSVYIAGLTLILGGLMIGTAVHGDMTRWVVISSQYLFGYLLLPMMFLNQPRWLAHRIVICFLVGMALLEASGIVASLTMDHARASRYLSQEFISGNGRVSSFAAEPNWNGQLISMAFPLLIYCYAKRLISLLLFITIAVLLAWGLLLCASFAGFIAAVITVSITLLFAGIRRIAAALVIIAVAGSIYVASGAPMPAAFEKRVAGAISEADLDSAGTYAGRVKLIRLAWETSEDTMLLGLGVEGFRKTNDIQQPVHNLFLLLLVDGGFMSLLGLCVLVGTLVWTPLPFLAQNRLGVGTALALIAAFLIYTQSNPHMFSRLNINPVMFSLLLLYVGDGRVTRKF